MIAIPLHQSRVAPVLDWCSTILLIPKHADISWQDGERLMIKSNIFELLRLLHSLNVSPIICGALSPQALHYGQHLGLEFIYGISGAIGEVVEAYRGGGLDLPRFRLPGCGLTCYPQSSSRPGSTHHDLEQGRTSLPKNQGKGGLMARQQGKSRAPSGVGRGAGSTMGAGGVEAVCVCPQCHWEASHRRGVPCNQVTCQKCGTHLVRKSSGR